MDSRRKCKIEKKWILLIGILILWIAGTGIVLHMNSIISEQQKKEWTTIHPEFREEINGTYEYYDNKRNRLIISMGGVSLTLLAALFLVMRTLHNRQIRNHIDMDKENFDILMSQIMLFQKGTYVVPPNMFRKNTSEEGQGVWTLLEEQIRELGYYFLTLKERLEVEENSTKSLITDISHQLKTPLASLKMSYELSQESNLTQTEKEEFIRKERQEILKLESLLEELVKLSRLESHMIQVEKRETRIRTLITEAMNQVILKAYEKNIKFEADIPEDTTIYVDEKWTVEAFVNVLDNAIKYSNRNKSVDLRVTKLPNLLLIEIEDEGMGIPPDELHKVFQRFYRGKKASEQVKEGAGVGLYLARRILEEQGGTITAKRKNIGTTLRITLPL